MEHSYIALQPPRQLFHHRNHRQDSSFPSRTVGKPSPKKYRNRPGCSKFGLRCNGIVGVKVTCIHVKLTLPKMDKRKLVMRRIFQPTFPFRSHFILLHTSVNKRGSSNPKMNPNPFYELYRRSRYRNLIVQPRRC